MSLRHGILVYGDDARLGGQVGPYLEEGLDGGEAVLAVLHPGHTTVVRDALPRADRVTFLDRDTFYVRPEAALAQYDAAVRSLLAGGARAVRVAGELPAATSAPGWDRWLSYEAILNRAMAHHPVSVLCVYDTREMPGDVVAAARESHELELDGDWLETPLARTPEALVRERTPTPAPLLLGLRNVPVDGDARVLRERLRRALEDAGATQAVTDDLLVAGGEVIANATTHGGGVTALRVGRIGKAVVCEVADRGAGVADPIAGYVPPSADHARGSGLWVARQRTRRLEVVTTPAGSFVRLWA